jgi:hypothetical protein
MCIPGAGGAGFPEDRMVRMVEIHQDEELGICLAKLNLFQGVFQMLQEISRVKT